MHMVNKLNRTLLILLAAGVLLFPLAACEREEGPMEEMGESLDNAVDDLKDNTDDLGDNLEDAADDLGDAVEDAGEDLEDAVDGDGQ